MAILIPPEGIAHEIEPAHGPAFTLQELQAFVGGYIEAVYLSDGRIMFINEDGKREELPINAIATELARMSGLAPWDQIVGPAIVCTRAEIAEEEPEE